jgi:hypothetical protein
MASASGQIATDDLLAIYREVSGVSERAGAIVIVAFIEESSYDRTSFYAFTIFQDNQDQPYF